MFKSLVKVLKSPSESLMKDFSPSFRKTIVDIHPIPSFKIDKFIEKVTKTGDVKTHISDLFPGKIIEQSVIHQLETDLATFNAKAAARKYFEHDLAKELGIDSSKSLIINDVNELEVFIKSNKKVQGVLDKFINVVKKNKLKFSVLALSTTGAAAYLLDSAKNLSGCYKYSIKGEEHVLCKVKNCDTYSAESVSINDKFCNDEDNCLSAKCNKNINCNFISNDEKISYHCFEASWLDVLGVALKNIKENTFKYFWIITKVLAVFIVIALTYSTLSDMQIVYRSLFSIASGITTLSIVF